MKTVQKEKIFDLARVEKVHPTQQVTDDKAETFIVGNPPYIGGKKQSAAHALLMLHCARDTPLPELTRVRGSCPSFRSGIAASGRGPFR